MMATTNDPSSFRITHLTHNLEKNVSTVTIFWNDESGKRLGLTVPFGTGLEAIHAEAEAAVRSLAAELAGMSVAPTGFE
jgi:hypothetical protein